MNKYFGLEGRLIGISMLLLSAYVSLTESSKSDFDGSEDRTTFACDGSPLLLACSEGVIQITRANYGRFSIAICNDEGRTDWSVNCFAPRSSAVLSETCNNLKKCEVNASDFDFGSNPCPETRRYLEAHYNCVPASDTALPPWMTSGNSKDSRDNQKPSRRVPITAAPTTTSTSTTTISTTTTTTSNTLPSSTTAQILMQSPSPAGSLVERPSSSTFRSVSAAPIFYVESTSSGLESLSFCPQRNQRGLRWPRTRSGSVAVLRCPNDPISTARWSCESGAWVGTWPDLSECESPWLRHLKKGIQREIEGDLDLLSGELLGRVRSSPLYGGDVRGILEILRGLVGRPMASWRLRDLISTLSTLLDKRSSPAWKDLNESLRENMLKELMTVTEDLGGGFRSNDLSLQSDNIDIVVKGNTGEPEGDDYLYFNSSVRAVGVRPLDLLDGKPYRSLVLSTFRHIHFFLDPFMSSEVKSVSLYEEGVRVNYEGGSVRARFLDVKGTCGVWNHVEWNRGLCEMEEGRPSGVECLCRVYGRMAIFSEEDGPPYMDGGGPGVRGTSEEEGDGISQVTFIIVVVVTSIISVASLLSFTLIIIYCRRVKIQDKWDRSWYCRKRETDLSETNTASTTVPLGISSSSRLLHHQMSLHGGTEGYSHPLFAGETIHGSTLNRHHLIGESPQIPTPHTAAGGGGGIHPSKKTHKGGYQELCINPQYGSQTLLGNAGGNHKSEWSSLAATARRSDYPSKRLNNSEELVFALPPTSNRIRPSRSGYQHHSSASSSSAGGQQHIYMEVDHRYDGDSGFTEDDAASGRRFPGPPRLARCSNSDELICDEEVFSSPRESRSSHSDGEEEDEEDFEVPLRSLGRHASSRRRPGVQPRSNEAYLLSWQMNNSKKVREKVYKDGDGTPDERDVFTITGFNR